MPRATAAASPPANADPDSIRWVREAAEYQAALYQVYLSRFGASARAYEVEFNLGEIYFHHLAEPTLAYALRNSCIFSRSSPGARLMSRTPGMTA